MIVRYMWRVNIQLNDTSRFLYSGTSEVSKIVLKIHSCSFIYKLYIVVCLFMYLCAKYKYLLEMAHHTRGW